MDQAQNKQSYVFVALVLRSALLAGFSSPILPAQGGYWHGFLYQALVGVAISIVLYIIEMGITRRRSLTGSLIAAVYRGVLMVFILSYIKFEEDFYRALGNCVGGLIITIVLYAFEEGIRKLVGKYQSQKA
jgi:hypothetical protein